MFDVLRRVWDVKRTHWCKPTMDSLWPENVFLTDEYVIIKPLSETVCGTSFEPILFRYVFSTGQITRLCMYRECDAHEGETISWEDEPMKYKTPDDYLEERKYTVKDLVLAFQRENFLPPGETHGYIDFEKSVNRTLPPPEVEALDFVVVTDICLRITNLKECMCACKHPLAFYFKPFTFDLFVMCDRPHAEGKIPNHFFCPIDPEKDKYLLDYNKTEIRLDHAKKYNLVEERVYDILREEVDWEAKRHMIRYIGESPKTAGMYAVYIKWDYRDTMKCTRPGCDGIIVVSAWPRRNTISRICTNRMCYRNRWRMTDTDYPTTYPLFRIL